MERLTDKHWRNLDPWECCGQDDFCQRGCHDEGGCANGCIVPKLYDKLAQYEDAGLSPKEIHELTHDSTGPLHKKLGQWIDAEKDGRLKIMPCKGGDTLYIVWNDDGELSVREYTALSVTFDRYGLSVAAQYIHGGAIFNYPVKYFGETIFFTHEEAEAALKGENNAN